MLRVCSVIERVRVPISDEAFQESDAEKEARIERVNGKHAGTHGIIEIICYLTLLSIIHWRVVQMSNTPPCSFRDDIKTSS